MIKYEKLWRIFASKIVKFGKDSSLLIPTKRGEQGAGRLVEEKDRIGGEIKGQVEEQFGFHNTLLCKDNGTEQDRTKGYKIWRIFVAEVTKKGVKLPRIVENAEMITLSLHNTEHKKP